MTIYYYIYHNSGSQPMGRGAEEAVKVLVQQGQLGIPQGPGTSHDLAARTCHSGQRLSVLLESTLFLWWNHLQRSWEYDRFLTLCIFSINGASRPNTNVWWSSKVWWNSGGVHIQENFGNNCRTTYCFCRWRDCEQDNVYFDNGNRQDLRKVGTVYETTHQIRDDLNPYPTNVENRVSS